MAFRFKKHQKMIRKKPTSLGEILNEEFLKPLGLTQKEFAEHLGCDYKVINRIINEKVRVTSKMAIKLAAVFKTTPDFWLNAQNTVDMWRLRNQKSDDIFN